MIIDFWKKMKLTSLFDTDVNFHIFGSHFVRCQFHIFTVLHFKFYTSFWIVPINYLCPQYLVIT